MTFSIFNSYDYKNKSFALAALDKLSTPCRLAFGGKKVYVLSQTSKETSTSARVAAVFFSVLIFPIAVISISSLVIKAATLPWIWQKKNVKNQSKQAEEMIKQFNATGTYDKAIEILMKSPEIGKNPDVYENFSNIVKTKINENCSFEDICEALPFLRQWMQWNWLIRLLKLDCPMTTKIIETLQLQTLSPISFRKHRKRTPLMLTPFIENYLPMLCD